MTEVTEAALEVNEQSNTEQRLKDSLERILADGEIFPDEIPRIELYMDQIITIFEERMARNKRDPEDKLLTKTMIHNYSKEKLIQPLAGKKYSREHILQILLIYQMKQVLSIQDIKKVLTDQASVSSGKKSGDASGKKNTADRGAGKATSVDFVELAQVYQMFLDQKQAIREFAREFAQSAIDGSHTEGLSDREARLLAVLNLTAMSNYMKRMAEQLIDDAHLPHRP